MVFVFVTGMAFLNHSIASELIPMQIIKEDGVGNGNTLAPPRPWYITQDDNVLIFPSLQDDYILKLYDEDSLVYSTFLPSGTISVVLPALISGKFELRLIGNNHYYKGYISL